MSNSKYIEEAGSYECIVARPEAGWFGEQGEKATPFIRVPLICTQPGSAHNKLAVWKGWLSDAAFDATIVRLKEVFGFDGDLAALEDGSKTIVGLPCNITTEIETYKGKELCKVAWLNPPGGGGPKAMDAGKVKSLLSRLTAKGKAIAKSVQGPPPANPTPSPNTSSSTPTSTATSETGSPGSDDDVPF